MRTKPPDRDCCRYFKIAYILGMLLGPLIGAMAAHQTTVVISHDQIFQPFFQEIGLFDAVPVEYRILGVASGAMMLAIIYVSRYAPLNNIYIIGSLVTSLVVGAMASYVFAFEILDAFANGSIAYAWAAFPLIVGISATVTIAIDRVLIHSVGEMLHKRKMKTS
ncbi:MAG: hypothetical protein FWD92_03465 [Methanomassiliicoccaceae archaeon]|nr:hypothetical protein [Methanomassiliicoccaceae archaeon]